MGIKRPNFHGSFTHPSPLHGEPYRRVFDFFNILETMVTKYAGNWWFIGIVFFVGEP
jgi:hypothetical protein